MPRAHVRLATIVDAFGPDPSWLRLRTSLGLRGRVVRLEPDANPYWAWLSWDDERFGSDQEVHLGRAGPVSKEERS